MGKSQVRTARHGKIALLQGALGTQQHLERLSELQLCERKRQGQSRRKEKRILQKRSSVLILQTHLTFQRVCRQHLPLLIHIPASKNCIAHILCDALVKAFNIVGNYTYSGQIFLAGRRPYLIGHLITLTLQTNRITLMEVREGRQQNWCG